MGQGHTLLSTASRHLPRWLEAPLLDAAGRGFYWFATRKRDAALQNHEMVTSHSRALVRRGGSAPPESVRRAFRVQIANYLEMLRAPALERASLRSRLRCSACCGNGAIRQRARIFFAPAAHPSAACPTDEPCSADDKVRTT